MKIVGLTLCLLSMIISERGGKADILENVQTHEDPKLLKAEELAGDPADNFGINQHKFVPIQYPEFSRRFVLQYPYREKPVEVINNAEEDLDRAIEQIQRNDIDPDTKLIPKKVKPEVLLSAAKEALKNEALNKPEDKHYKGLEKEIMRSGDYWDNFWVEPIPKPELIKPNALRTEQNVPNVPKLNVLRLKIMPGSRLHDIVAVAKQISPRLLYIINTNNKNKRR